MAPQNLAARANRLTRERQDIRQRGGLGQLQHTATVSLGDKATARAVAFNPETGQFVVASSDGLFAVEPNDGVTGRLRGHGDLRTVAVSRDGRIATTYYGNRITVLDRDGTELVRFKTPYSLWQRHFGGHQDFASPSWHDDQTRLAIGGSDRVWIYNVATERFGQLPLLEDESSTSLAVFVPGSDELIVVQRFNIWRVATATGELLRQLDTSTGSDLYAPHHDDGAVFNRDPSPVGFLPHCIALSADARNVALGGNDAQLVLLDSQTLRPLILRVWHLPLVTETNGRVEALAYSPDGTKLASVANDDRLVIGDAERGDPIAEGNLSRQLIAPFTRIKRRVCWSANGSRIAVTNGEGRIEIFDAQT